MACIIHQWKALFLYFLTVYYVSTLEHLTRSEMYTLNGQWCLTTGGAKVVSGLYSRLHSTRSSWGRVCQTLSFRKCD